MKLTDALDNHRTKIIINFECENVSSIKSSAVNRNSEAEITSRFFNGKMLFLAKLSLMHGNIYFLNK